MKSEEERIKAMEEINKIKITSNKKKNVFTLHDGDISEENRKFKTYLEALTFGYMETKDYDKQPPSYTITIDKDKDDILVSVWDENLQIGKYIGIFDFYNEEWFFVSQYMDGEISDVDYKDFICEDLGIEYDKNNEFDYWKSGIEKLLNTKINFNESNEFISNIDFKWHNYEKEYWEYKKGFYYLLEV